MRYKNLNEVKEALSMPPGENIATLGFGVDTRKLVPGQVFVALPGEKNDGHRFLKEAKEKGAVAAIVSKDYRGEEFGLSLLKVSNPLDSMQKLAKNAALNNRIIAVTGSVGKTTCKEFIATLLKGKFKVAYTKGNCNTKISLPLTILNHSGFGEDALVLEMGMSQRGEIAKLVEIAPPEIALVTYVSLAHSMNFETLQDIALAKGEIFNHPKTRLGIMPKEVVEEEHLQSIGSCEKRSFSITSPLADFYLKQNESGFELYQMRQFAAEMAVSFNTKHLLHNALAAVAVAREWGLGWQEINERLPLLKVLDGRGNAVEKNGIVFIDDSYNASPQSMKAALSSIPEPKAFGKKVAVLGEMFELGKFSRDAHIEIGKYALDKVDELLCLGMAYEPVLDCSKRNQQKVFVSKSKLLIMDRLKNSLRSGDVVLLKGSNSCKMWEILDNFI